jgi:hypothetical protein
VLQKGPAKRALASAMQVRPTRQKKKKRKKKKMEDERRGGRCEGRDMGMRRRR